MKRFYIIALFFLITISLLSIIPVNLIRTDERLAEQFVDNWNGYEWVFDKHHIYEYNEDNQLIEYIILNYIDGEWCNSKLRTYTYDPDGLLTEMLVFNTSSSEWVNYQKYTYNYNENDLLNEYYYYLWENELWQETYRHQYIYDENLLLIEHYRDDWSGSGWTDEYGHWYSYNSNNDLIEDLVKTCCWTNNGRHEYSYNSNGDVEVYQFFIWNDEFNEWWLIEDYFYDYEYDNGIMITKTTSNWSSNDIKELYTYNNNDNLIETVLQDWSSGNWVNDARTTSIYESTQVNENVIVDHKNSIDVYPNPFNPSTTIKLELAESGKTQLAIYNIKGQKVITLMDTYADKGAFEINWNGKDKTGNPVSSGQYVIKFQQNGKQTAKKILMLK